jgi:RNA polymerase sigma factor (sigma-70 family)
MPGVESRARVRLVAEAEESSTPTVTDAPREVFHRRVIDRTSGERANMASGATFEAFFEAEHRQLFRSLVLITSDRQEADDVAQEAMVRILERWDRVERMDDPRAYLYRTALNLNRNRHRWMTRRRSRSTDSRDVLPDAADAVATRVDVRRALEGLTSEQRIAVVLVDFLGFDSEGAGRVLDLNADAVRARVRRGRSALRERLTEDG